MDNDNKLGIIFGQAIGDALGLPVEGSNPTECQRYLQKINLDQLIARNGYNPGQISDDTQLALELLQSLKENNGFSKSDFAKRIGNLFKEDLIVGRGMATQAAAEKIIEGVHVNECATPSPAAGNGTAMRSAPIGIFYDGNIDNIIKFAVEQSKITHQDDRCTAGSLTIALAVSYLGNLEIDLDKDELDKHDFIEFLANQIESISKLFAKNILKLKETLEMNVIGAARIISTWGNPDFMDGWKYISPYVIPSVCWSIWSFLKSPTDYKETISNAISGGGDVDTTAAMAGALSGAFLGVGNLPQNWMHQIHDQERWDYQKIKNLIDI